MEPSALARAQLLLNMKACCRFRTMYLGTGLGDLLKPHSNWIQNKTHQKTFSLNNFRKVQHESYL
ncbi:hypothetical protein AZI87_01965 [Bdellovibrio bacteriovorus]|uniref:Uncharacterized protein n=1 Tax=Bdellovibrio bacteriovorus TaxID=959 RepID=A0A161PD13_BDEBC|nr:hypothetical protein AZI87_01965 [Bdellovibrio bacteriovorus]